MEKVDKEVKAQVLDLAKVLSYLTELQKTNNQDYVTDKGLALLEGLVLGGSKVKVVGYDKYGELMKEFGKDVINSRNKINREVELNDVKTKEIHSLRTDIESKDCIIDEQQKIINKAQAKIKRLEQPWYFKLF